MRKNSLCFLLCVLFIAACSALEVETGFQADLIAKDLVPYTSDSLGIKSVVPSDWVAYRPTGVFVRTLPQIDPTFLMFAVIPGVSRDQVPGLLMDIAGLQKAPVSSGDWTTDEFEWTLYSQEIRRGFLLDENPDYGTLILDVALADIEGGVILVTSGSPIGERDQLYDHVFLPATDGLTLYQPIEGDDKEEIDLPDREYWPTEAWQVSSPKEQGMDGGRLLKMVEYIRENEINIHSVLVIRHGYLVLEEYFRGNNSAEGLASIAKSITSALVGIAIDQGYISEVGEPVLSYFPEREIANLDAKKKKMTIEDLLTMRSGLDWPPGPCPWLDGAECADYTTQIMFENEDSLQFILDQPMASEPGTTFDYCAGATHLLSAIISETTGLSLLDFAKENLFQPLGIENVSWPTDGEGLNTGYGDIVMQPQSMAKVGYLFLNQGQWDGKQVISAGWVQESQKPHTKTPPDKIQPAYGYQWWVDPELGFYNAAGAGGNLIIVVPGLDMVVVFSANISGKWGEGSAWEGTPDELFRVYILPAVIDQAE